MGRSGAPRAASSGASRELPAELVSERRRGADSRRQPPPVSLLMPHGASRHAVARRSRGGHLLVAVPRPLPSAAPSTPPPLLRLPPPRPRPRRRARLRRVTQPSPGGPSSPTVDGGMREPRLDADAEARRTCSPPSCARNLLAVTLDDASAEHLEHKSGTCEPRSITDRRVHARLLLHLPRFRQAAYVRPGAPCRRQRA